MKYEILTVGEMTTNCYLLWDSQTLEAAVIDPADEGDYIVEEIDKRKLKVVAILATHGHFDHLMAALDLKLIYNAPFYASSKDMFLLNRQQKTAAYFLKKKNLPPNLTKIDVDLDTINKIKLGRGEIEIIQTPGHTPGSVCFYIKDEDLLFSGDTLFADTVGRTDLSYSDEQALKNSLDVLELLPRNTILLPGHGKSCLLASCF